MRIARLSATAVLIALIPMGCVRSEAGAFSIHLLADDMPATELSTVDLDELELQEQPIVSPNDIITYSRSTHEMELTAEAYARIGQLFTLPAEVRGIPFVVSVGPDRIYAGAFWTPASSISFDGVVILQPFNPDERVITIGLGYPSPEAFAGEDPRSAPRILESLEVAGILR